MSRFITSPNAQGTPEWFADRMGMVTGSTAKSALARSKIAGAGMRVDLMMDLALQNITKVQPEEGYKSQEMLWGNEQEPHARMAYELRTGLDVSESGFVYLASGVKAGCSVDGFVVDGGRKGFTEFKCPKSKTHWGYIVNGAAPSEYATQITHNFWITGYDFCDFMSFDPRMPEKLREFHIRIERDEAAVKAHEAGVLQFLEELAELETMMRARAGM